MFANYNLDEFPKVEIIFGKTIKDDEDFGKFIKQWLMLNQRQEKFHFLMDTTKTGMVSVKYCFEMSKFINHIKKSNKNFLQYSIILVSNGFIMGLLKLIFTISKPVAPVYIVKKKQDYYKLEGKLNKNLLPMDVDFSYVKSYLE